MPRMPKTAKAAPVAPDSPMNALALRIWEGQSIDLPLITRVNRIKAALESQGFSADEIQTLSLPAEGFGKYL